MGLLMPRGGVQRPSLAWKPQQFEQGTSLTLPAPFGGLNLRDDINALKPNEARNLDNWIPALGDLRVRPGTTAYATGLGSGEVQTVKRFDGLTATKLIAGCNGALWDISSSGAGTSLASGFTSNRWQSVCFGNKLIMCNGADTPQTYDGSTVGSGGWSGVTVTGLVNVALARNRIWFAENNQAWVWYGASGGITGALTKFDLSQIAQGGTCTAIGHWSRDAGTNPDDYTVFVMSTGEVIIYLGDPASTFSLVGKYRTAPPIGRQCLLNLGGELLIITKMGLVPVSAAISGVALDFAALDPWGKVQPGIVADSDTYATTAGWNMHLHNGLLYLTVPQIAGTLTKQWVLNTRTGGWATCSGYNASCMETYGAGLYFGASTGGVVHQVTGSSDLGSDIIASANCAFVYPNQAQNNNLFTGIRPKLQSSGAVAGLIGVDTNFVIRPFVGDAVPIAQDTSTTPWETSSWETSSWGTANAVVALWFSITGEGRSVSPRFQAIGQTTTLQWLATDLLYKPGGIR